MALQKFNVLLFIQACLLYGMTCAPWAEAHSQRLLWPVQKQLNVNGSPIPDLIPGNSTLQHCTGNTKQDLLTVHWVTLQPNEPRM